MLRFHGHECIKRKENQDESSPFGSAKARRERTAIMTQRLREKGYIVRLNDVVNKKYHFLIVVY